MAALGDVTGSIEAVALAGFFIFGAAAFTIYPVTVAHLIDHVHQQDILAGNTGILFLHGVGAAIGPMIAGALLGLAGPAGLPLHFAIAFAPLAVFALLQARRGSDEIVDEAAHFSPMLRTSPTALDMVAPDAEASAEAQPDAGDPSAGAPLDASADGTTDAAAEPFVETADAPRTAPSPNF